MNRVWERVMLALVVCVPVPAFALSGLNVPLPSVVERIAATLVPFASVATLDEETTLASGKIVHTSAREATTATAARTKTKVVVRVRRTAAPSGAAKPEPSTARVAAGLTPGVRTTLAPATTLGEATTPSVPEPQPSAPTPSPTPTRTPTEPAPTPAPDRKPEPKPADRVEPAPPDEPDVKPDPKPDVDVVPLPDVKVDLKVDVLPPVPEVKPNDPLGSLETAVREPGK